MAVYVTRDGHSLNQQAINLHMLEDVLGWLLVLIGSIIMKFTNIHVIDPILSILVSVFIFKNAFLHLKEALDLFLEKKPEDIDIEEIKKHILKIKGVKNIHHFHIWAIDEDNVLATMHVVSKKNVKQEIKEELEEHGINHSTIEFEDEDEECSESDCNIKLGKHGHCHHHHHH
jgi:cobalt-zinc-cadmium efflux system protein